MLDDTLMSANGITEDRSASLYPTPQSQEVREMWRQREAMVRAQSKLVLSSKAALRRILNNDKKLAAKVYSTTAKEITTGTPVEEMTYPEYLSMVLPFVTAMQPLENQKKIWDKAMSKAGKQFPISFMADEINGVTHMTIAKVVAELGDLSCYDKGISGIWKRAGLAVIDGERQHKCTNAEKAIAHGYSPSRRSVFWNIADSMFKSQGKLVEDPDTGEITDTRTEWRVYYDDQKAKEMERPGMTNAQAHNRAMRNMTKKLLRLMHREWMRAVA